MLLCIEVFFFYSENVQLMLLRIKLISYKAFSPLHLQQMRHSSTSPESWHTNGDTDVTTVKLTHKHLRTDSDTSCVILTQSGLG